MSSAAHASKPALWTRNFMFAFASNLFLFLSFYMLIPVLPVYVTQELGTTKSVAGIVLSLYTISALLIRPFSGLMVDTFARKPFYLVCYGFFCIIFAGYVIGSILTLFIVLRILHGVAFGISTVSGSTVAVDIIVPERRGEGIGYYGMAANIAMATGPVAGLWIQKAFSFNALFIAALISSLIGWLAITRIKITATKPVIDAGKRRITLNNFVLTRALPCILPLLIGGIGYGCILNYIGLYSETASFKSSAGAFFVLIALGIVLARVISAKAIRKGRLIAMIYMGCGWLILSFGLFAVCSNAAVFYIIAFFLGVGFGYITPAFQTMLIDFAEPHQRGTANATYFTFWDVGIGFGTAAGGTVIEHFDFQWLYGMSSGLLVLAVIYFTFIAVPYFEKRNDRKTAKGKQQPSISNN